MKKLLFLLLLPVIAWSQVTTGFHRVNQVLARGASGTTAVVVPYATVLVTSTATGTAAMIYRDPLLSVLIAGSTVTADSSGNYAYYIPLNYCVNEKVSAPGQGTYTTQNICVNGGMNIPLPVPITDGGTGATTTSGALANLGAAPSTSPTFSTSMILSWLTGSTRCLTVDAGGNVGAGTCGGSGGSAIVANVKDFGAVADYVASTGNANFTSGSATLYCASCTFTNADVGKYGVGYSSVPINSRTPSVFKILSVTDSTHVVMDTPAINTVNSGLRYGTDNVPAFNACALSVYNNSPIVGGVHAGGTCSIPAGFYFLATAPYSLVSFLGMDDGSYGTTAGGTGATIQCVPVAGQIVSGGCTITNAGSGYTPSSTLQVTGQDGWPYPQVPDNGAFLTATSNSSGQITGVNVVYPGTGYTTTQNMTVVPLGGDGAAATVTLSGGSINGTIITNPGAGYKASDAGLNAFALVGASGCAAIYSGVQNGVPTGYGYNSTLYPAIAAQGHANTNSSGQVTSVTWTNAGSGCTGTPTVFFGPTTCGGVQCTNLAPITPPSIPTQIMALRDVSWIGGTGVGPSNGGSAVRLESVYDGQPGGYAVFGANIVGSAFANMFIDGQWIGIYGIGSSYSSYTDLGFAGAIGMLHWELDVNTYFNNILTYGAASVVVGGTYVQRKNINTSNGGFNNATYMSNITSVRGGHNSQTDDPIDNWFANTFFHPEFYGPNPPALQDICKYPAATNIRETDVLVNGQYTNMCYRGITGSTLVVMGRGGASGTTITNLIQKGGYRPAFYGIEQGANAIINGVFNENWSPQTNPQALASGGSCTTFPLVSLGVDSGGHFNSCTPVIQGAGCISPTWTFSGSGGTQTTAAINPTFDGSGALTSCTVTAGDSANYTQDPYRMAPKLEGDVVYFGNVSTNILNLGIFAPGNSLTQAAWEMNWNVQGVPGYMANSWENVACIGCISEPASFAGSGFSGSLEMLLSGTNLKFGYFGGTLYGGSISMTGGRFYPASGLTLYGPDGVTQMLDVSPTVLKAYQANLKATSGTNCVQVDTAGNITKTGSPCSGGVGTITQVIAGTGLSGGGSSGAVTVNCAATSTTTLGCMKPDGTSLTCTLAGVCSAAGSITQITAGTGLIGGGTIGNVTLTCATAAPGTPGCMQPDGTTITCPGGVCSAAGASTATAVPSWLLNVGSGVDGDFTATSTTYGGDYAYHNYTVPSNVTLSVGYVGLTIHATGTCTILGTMKSFNQASPGSAATLGGAGGAGGGGTSGGAAGAATIFRAINWSNGGTGGAVSGGTGGNGQYFGQTTGSLENALRMTTNSGFGSELIFQYSGPGGLGNGNPTSSGVGAPGTSPAITLICNQIVGTDGVHTGTIDVSGQPGAPSDATNHGANGGGGAGVAALSSIQAVTTWPAVYVAGGGGGLCTVPQAIAEGGTCTQPPKLTLPVSAGALNGSATVVAAGAGCGTGAGINWVILGGGGTQTTAAITPTWSGGAVTSATVSPGDSSGYTAATYTNCGAGGNGGYSGYVEFAAGAQVH